MSIKLSSTIRWTLSSVLITNIGNGIHTITIGKILYDETGSASSFGIVILFEYIINLLFQTVAGFLVDRSNPKLISIVSDLTTGVFITIASYFMTPKSVFWWILGSTIIINSSKPFYRSATFSIGPAISKGDLLLKYNSLSASFLQIGQLFGISISGLLIQYLGTNVAFGMNGISYIISGVLVWIARIPRIEVKRGGNNHFVRTFLNDWKEVVLFLRSNKSLSLFLLFSAGDFLVVNFINISLVPFVNTWFNGSAYWLSILDGSFAIGSIIIGYVSSDIVKKFGRRKILISGIGFQALLLAYLSIQQYPISSIFVMILLGIFNTLSITTFMTNIQEMSIGPIKGRIASVRYLILSIFAGIIIPGVTYMYQFSVQWGLITSAIVSLFFCVLMYLVSKRYSVF